MLFFCFVKQNLLHSKYYSIEDFLNEVTAQKDTGFVNEAKKYPLHFVRPVKQEIGRTNGVPHNKLMRYQLDYIINYIYTLVNIFYK